METVHNGYGLTDEQIVAGVAAGDRELFGLLWQRHGQWSLAFARKLAGGEGEDAHQAAWTGVFQAIVNGGGPKQAFGAYLNRAVRNAALDRVTCGGAEPVGGASELERLLFADAEVADESLYAHTVIEAFNTLPERYRRALWETLVEGYSPAEVAPELGMSPNAVAVLTYRARGALRRAWNEKDLPASSAAEHTRSRRDTAVLDRVAHCA